MKYRDLTILPITKNKHLVVTCDASASIGEKEQDFLQVPTSIVSAYCTRVALFELLAFGAKPVSIIHLVGDEFEDTGRKALVGVYEELAKAGLKNIEVNGSTEENMPTYMTSIGVTGIGVIEAKAYNLSPLQAGDCLYRVGIPVVGQDVLDKVDQIASYEDIKRLRACSSVRDILPVGSKGILYEASQMGVTSHLAFEIDERWFGDSMLTASSGPATSLLVGVAKEEQQNFVDSFSKAVYMGCFYRHHNKI